MSGRFTNRRRSVLLPGLIPSAASVFGKATRWDKGSRDTDDRAMRNRSFGFLRLQVREGNPANRGHVIFQADQAEGTNTVPLDTTLPISLAGAMDPPRTKSSAGPPPGR